METNPSTLDQYSTKKSSRIKYKNILAHAMVLLTYCGPIST